ncbi:IQ-DOMAIN 14-like protein [Tanacetum coccineum]
MGLEALPDSATTNQKQEMGVTPISPPRCLGGYSDHPNYMSHTESSRAKLRSLSAPGGRRRSNVQPNDDQHREAVGEVKKATYRGTQVSREVSLIEPVSDRRGLLQVREKICELHEEVRDGFEKLFCGEEENFNRARKGWIDYDGELSVLVTETLED